MRSLHRSLLALFVMALWLPATMHCGLEAAMTLTSDHVLQGCCADGSAVADDCALIENGNIKPTQCSAKVPAPLMLVDTFFLETCLLALVPPQEAPTFYIGTSAYPEDWIAAWKFVRRVVPLARAPAPLA